MFPSNTRHPGVRAGQRFAHRNDLADLAALVRIASPELVAVQLRLARGADALVDLDLDPVALLEALPGLVGLGE